MLQLQDKQQTPWTLVKTSSSAQVDFSEENVYILNVSLWNIKPHSHVKRLGM